MAPARDEAALAALEEHFNRQFNAGEAAKKSKQKVEKEQKRREKGSKPTRTDSEPGPSQRAKEPETIVFGQEASTSATGRPGEWRRFMKTKIDVGKEKSAIDVKGKRKQRGEDNDDASDSEQAMQTNDKILSELLSTTLFAKDQQRTRANGRPDLSSNATLSRLMELSQPTLTGKAKSVARGLGNHLVKSNQRSQAPQKMRIGMQKAQENRQRAEVDQAKELGLYHSSIKGMLGKGHDEKRNRSKRREKGLSMGVGRFANGTLKLDQSHVDRINNKKKRKS